MMLLRPLLFLNGSWNFTLNGGVRQGGRLSPLMFWGFGMRPGVVLEGAVQELPSHQASFYVDTLEKEWGHQDSEGNVKIPAKDRPWSACVGRSRCLGFTSICFFQSQQKFWIKGSRERGGNMGWWSFCLRALELIKHVFSWFMQCWAQ